MRANPLAVALACAASCAGQQPQRQDPDWVKDAAPRHIVLSVPGMREVNVRRDLTYKRAGAVDLKMDVYTPRASSDGSKLHAVIFVHGGYLPPNLKTEPKDWGGYVSLGQLAAASGLAGITFNHRYYERFESLRDSATDLADLIRLVREHARELGVDGDHLTLWAFSGGGPLLTAYIREPQPYITSLVDYYAILDLREPAKDPKSGVTEALARDFSATPLLGSGKAIPPIFIGRAGLDNAWLNRGLDEFVAAALAHNLSIDVANHPQGKHGFDVFTDDERSREILRRTIEFVRAH